MALFGSLRATSAVIKSYPGDLPNGKFFMKVLITDGEKHLGGKVRGSGLSKKVLIVLIGGGG
jgi:hypothetical protein